MRELKLPTLLYRRIRGDMIETYKITSQKYDPSIENMFPMHKDKVKASSSLRGHEKKIFKERSKTKIRKNFFTQRVVSLWNNLPAPVVNAPSVKSFERRLDKAWEREDVKFDFNALIENKARNRNIGYDDLCVEGAQKGS